MLVASFSDVTAGTAAGAVAFAAVGIGSAFAAGSSPRAFAARAAIGVLHHELLIGIWVAPLVFLTVCPLGIALTRRIAGQAVAEGGYSFYPAAF